MSSPTDGVQEARLTHKIERGAGGYEFCTHCGRHAPSVLDGECPTRLRLALDTARTEVSAPIPMILHCPACGLQHVDAPDERTPEWTNPPHKSHLCHGCGHIWRPCDRPTNGVAVIATAGSNDSPKTDPREARAEVEAAHKHTLALEQQNVALLRWQSVATEAHIDHLCAIIRSLAVSDETPRTLRDLSAMGVEEEVRRAVAAERINREKSEHTVREWRQKAENAEADTLTMRAEVEALRELCRRAHHYMMAAPYVQLDVFCGLVRDLDAALSATTREEG